VRGLREFLGWTQTELAQQLGVRQQTISEWEIGKHAPRGACRTVLSMLAREQGYDPLTGDIPLGIGWRI
jgi:DNA-binding transcriptional regulator YiaG